MNADLLQMEWTAPRMAAAHIGVRVIEWMAEWGAFTNLVMVLERFYVIALFYKSGWDSVFKIFL